MRLRRLKIANMSDVVTSDNSCRCVSSYCAYSYKKYLMLTKGVHVLLFVRKAWLCGCAKVSAQPEIVHFMAGQPTPLVDHKPGSASAEAEP